MSLEGECMNNWHNADDVRLLYEQETKIAELEAELEGWKNSRGDWVTERDIMQERITELEEAVALVDRSFTASEVKRHDLEAEVKKLKELLATERMSADKTLEHNNRLINNMDRLQRFEGLYETLLFRYEKLRSGYGLDKYKRLAEEVANCHADIPFHNYEDCELCNLARKVLEEL